MATSPRENLLGFPPTPCVGCTLAVCSSTKGASAGWPAPRSSGPVTKPSTDMLMLAYTRGGRERTAEELAALWKRASLRCVNETALASEATLFELQLA